MMNQKKKAIAFTAFMIFISLLIVITLFFLISATVSPPGKTIVKEFVYPGGTPIEGLSVTLDGETGVTDANGCVEFGGLVDGTHTISWNWQNVAYEETVTINCTKITWEFTNTLPYWEVVKIFTYPDGTPIVGLDVAMDGWSGVTDADGMVCFSNVPPGTYTITWSWQNVTDSEVITINFETPSPVELENELPYWTVVKYFYYDLAACDHAVPIVGLDVTLQPSGIIRTTDANGKVEFTNVKAGSYTLEWMWCNESYSHPVNIDFNTESPIELTNRLPGKYLKVGVFCAETEDSVPKGLKVTVSGVIAGEAFTDTKYTTNNGYTPNFGSGYPDGTYIVSFYWNELYTYEVEITCTQQYWTFNYYVPNPTITKHFVYDNELAGYPPVVGLEVSLYGDGTFVVSKVTDATGTVVFDGSFVEVCRVYSLKYTWNSTEKEIGPIHFGYTNGELLVCAWEETNKLVPKDGGDNNKPVGGCATPILG